MIKSIIKSMMTIVSKNEIEKRYKAVDPIGARRTENQYKTCLTAAAKLRQLQMATVASPIGWGAETRSARTLLLTTSRIFPNSHLQNRRSRPQLRLPNSRRRSTHCSSRASPRPGPIEPRQRKRSHPPVFPEDA